MRIAGAGSPLSTAGVNWALLQNSLLVSGLTTLCSVGVGLMAALWLAGLERAWQNRILAAAILALALPPFLITNCWLHFLGLAGVWRGWLPLNVYSLGGTVWILTLLLWPITVLAALGAWRRVEAAQLESDSALGGGALIRWLLWPMARASVGHAAFLTFVLALNNFSVPSILQVKVFPAELWVKLNTTGDVVGALQLSWPLIVAPLLLLLCLRRTELGWTHSDGPAPARAIRRQLGWGWVGASGIVTALILFFAVGLPLGQLFATARTWSELPGAFLAAGSSFTSSGALAATTASLCVAVGLAGRRWSGHWFAWLLFLVPGVLLSIGIIFVFNRPVLEVIYHSFAVVVVAWTMRYLAPAWQSAALAFQAVDHDLTDAAHLSGASGWFLFWHVHWPQIAPRLGAAWYVTYLLCLWDVETLVLLYPPGGETLALRIFNLLHYGHNTQVNALCVLLLALALAPLALWQFGDWLRHQITGP